MILRTRHIHGTRWVAVIKTLPLGLGVIYRLEAGPIYRGPGIIPVEALDWWWRPTFDSAHKHAYDTVERLEGKVAQ